MARQGVIYELWDNYGKVHETLDSEWATKWKQEGELKRNRDGSKSKFIRRRKVWYRN